MSSTAFNRKYVFLSPIRAQRALACVLKEKAFVLEQRRTHVEFGDRRHLWQDVLNDYNLDLQLLQDIEDRLKQQTYRTGKTKPANDGVMKLPEVIEGGVTEETEFTLVQPTVQPKQLTKEY